MMRADGRLVWRERFEEILPEEFEEGERELIRCMQAEAFPEIWNQLQVERSVKSNRPGMQSLVLEKDRHNIIHSTGRLRNTVLKYDEQCPILLPSEGHLFTLLLHHYHIAEHHHDAGLGKMLSEIGRRFWVVHLRKAVVKYLKNCSFCTRRNARPRRLPQKTVVEARTIDPDMSACAQVF
jgi:hypothetical protein